MQALTGQHLLVTGGTDGIGREVARRLLALGASLTLVGRSAQRGAQAVAALQAGAPGGSVGFQAFDLSQMREVRRLADALPALDGVVHCAGVMLRRRTLTPEGLETVFAVQYLARFLLTNALLPALAARPRAWVVNVSAGGTINRTLDFDNLNGEKHYSGVGALTHESVANDMLTLSLNERAPSHVRCFCYGPGFVRTTLLRDMDFVLRAFAGTFGQLIAISPQQAADDVLGLVTGDAPGGLYTRRGRRTSPSAFKASAENRARLWAVSEQMIAAALAGA